MTQFIDQTRAKIIDTGWEIEKFLVALDTALNEQQPSTMSALVILCNLVTYQQANAKGLALREQEEAHERASECMTICRLKNGANSTARQRERCFLLIHRSSRLASSINKTVAPLNGRSGHGIRL